mmetsp:Transcript_102308/g.180245  ORF Transcript_102308/g.180245 Transcript_102308/m.180245 type:complete len:734 (-) Transcript_102308:82-2283(-)
MHSMYVILSFAFLAGTAADPTGAVSDLINRVVGSHSQSFALEVIPKDSHGREVMGLASHYGKVLLQGSSGVSLASALNWYLNDFLNTTYDWSTYEVLLPESLPLPPSKTLTRVVKFSYYLNVCTYGYSLAFVDWAYWEKHIDWMAMQGINLPLAFLGQEKVLELTFSRFNISFEELQHFISGPAFLPWFRMANMQAWGGPITQHWLDSRVELQHKVLARMRSLGMTPVLPAFNGFLPPAFVAKYPHANVTRQTTDWGNFKDPYSHVYMLEPTDTFFKSIGQAFIEEQTKMYGTDHIYQCDTYNELIPRSGDLNYLASSSRAVFSAMQAGDPEAVWLMQGWLFLGGFWSNERIQAYLGAVPDENLWILDLKAESEPVWKKTDSFFGKPYIWNTLHDFGGQQGLIGGLPAISEGFALALNSSRSIQGVGLTMEGIWTNYLVYDFTLSHAWGRAGDPLSWTKQFGARRYGPNASAGATEVWSKLYNLTYIHDGPSGPRSGLITVRPKFTSSADNLKSDSPWNFTDIWRDLLALAPQVGRVKAYRFDLIDVGREVLTREFSQHAVQFQKAVGQKNVSAAENGASSLLAVIDDFDRLLSTDENFMLGRWLSWAQAWGATPEEKKWLDFNARNQITLWGPRGEILDYATKAWGGLAKSFFKPRWSLFTKKVLEALKAGKAFNQSAFETEVLEEVEIPWQNASDTFPTKPLEDAVEISRLMLAKYSPGAAMGFQSLIAFV